MGSIGAIALIYFFLIAPQVAQNKKLESQITTQKGKLQQIQDTIKSAGTSLNAATGASTDLAAGEEDVARGDLYAWTYDKIRKFKSGFKVDVPSIGQPTTIPPDLFPEFPYKQIRFSLNGTGYYHDIGKFISAFENHFPHMRLVNLTIEPSSGQDSTTEKLSFRMDVVALVKPNT